MTPRVSVLIPSYNSKNTLLPCLERLRAQTFAAGQFEVIVTLDGSTDGSLAALQALRPPYPLRVVTQANKGRAAALNRAAQEAAGEYLLIIDSDILVEPDFIAQHMAAHAAADVVTGPVPVAAQSPDNFLTDGVRRWSAESAGRLAGNGGRFTCADIYGANLSIARAQFAGLGGYREDLRRTEDFHLGAKILRAGLRVVYCAAAPAYQIYDKTFSAWRRDFYWDGRSQYALAREFPGEKKYLPCGRYFPQTLTKRVLRALAIRGGACGDGAFYVLDKLMELARQRGWRHPLFSRLQGVIGDAAYWRGVYDASGAREAFDRFICENSK